ncbi:anaerobic ribonucleoside-triphosphate reductase [Chitinilyticum aquatile]|uniref:anaerobic ribonucleoside-triphosphate reductase n=1 Tax=Chitinilyticum aquatile TaxID=362520 RepID=UPI00040A81DB|nr:anaerobic ribonucleoside-triphosphate reductase [Chitinilyticum aquatile]
MTDLSVQTNFKVELKDEERTRCEVWTRVMGYHRPVTSFNVGKKGEFAERKFFEESRSGCCQ